MLMLFSIVKNKIVYTSSGCFVVTPSVFTCIYKIGSDSGFEWLGIQVPRIIINVSLKLNSGLIYTVTFYEENLYCFINRLVIP